MKKLLCAAIVVLSGIVGYFYKNKIKKEISTIKHMLKFINFYYQNLMINKNSLTEIIESFLIMQNIKNANNCNIFQKSGSIYIESSKYFDENIYKNDINNFTKSYFHNIGSGNIDFEIERSKDMINYLNEQLKIDENELKQKGDLVFKLMLAIGAVIAILIW